MVSCHATYKWICVTPLPYNGTDCAWKQIQAHIKGICNSSDLYINIYDLNDQISSISHAHLQMPPPEEIAASVLSFS